MAGTEPLLRPLEGDDRERLVRLYHRCSSETIYRRFFSAPPPEPPAFMLDWLVTVDHTSREAVAAAVDDEVIGVARFDRDDADPTRAEFAVLVEDARQGEGVGRRLMEELLATAQAKGVHTLYGLTQPDNAALVGLVRAVAPDMTSRWEDGLVRVEMRTGA